MSKRFIGLLASSLSVGVAIATPFEYTDTLDVLLGDGDAISISYLLQDDELILNLQTGISETGGWIGFGIAENRTGSMKGSDIVTVQFNEDGEPEAVDRHLGWVAYPMSPETAFPLRDDQQDWEILEAEQANETLFVTLKRKIDTGDHEEDRVIDTKFESRIIVAKGSGQFISYHGASRAASALDFSRVLPPATFADNVDQYDDVIDVIMHDYNGYSPRITTYAQKAFSFEFDDERDIVAIEPVISANTNFLLHHMVIYDCSVPHSFYPNKTFDTQQELMATTGSYCETVVGAWAIGGRPFVFPPDVGLRIGGNGIRSVTLEVHYDNRAGIDLPDNSGLRVYTTKTLRKHSAYMLTLGDVVLSFSSLKAGEDCAYRRGVCNSQCTSKFGQPLTTFGSLMHMHALGRQAYTMKNGEIMNKVDFWDVGFQLFKPVSYTVNPGDVLETICTYDASLSKTDIQFDQGFYDEMCLDFVYYYPKDHFAGNCGFSNLTGIPGNTFCGGGGAEFINGEQNEFLGQNLENSEFLKESTVCFNRDLDGSYSAPGSAPSFAALLASSIALMIVAQY